MTDTPGYYPRMFYNHATLKTAIAKNAEEHEQYRNEPWHPGPWKGYPEAPDALDEYIRVKNLVEPKNEPDSSPDVDNERAPRARRNRGKRDAIGG